MATYRIKIEKRVVKSLLALPKKVRHQLSTAIDSLAENPRPTGTKKLAGSTNLYRLRVGSYRIIYKIEDAELIVLLVKIGHRRDIYWR